MIYTVLLVTVVLLAAGGCRRRHRYRIRRSWKEGDFPKVAAQIGGPWLGTGLTLAALVSAAGMFNALLCTSARVPFAMAERAMLPRALAGFMPFMPRPGKRS